MDDRRLTLIVVPHGDAEMRTFEITYRRLKVLLGAAGVAVVALAVIVATWWMVAAQAARVPGLEREVARLEEERSQVVELARTLEEVEAQYERVREMLGADGPAPGQEPLLPPLRPGDADRPTSLAPPDSEERPTAWPLTQAGFITQEATGRVGSGHPGLDIAVPQHSYIRAAGPGVVRDAGADPVYGLYVLVDHGGGLASMYGHASELFVEPGDRVERREVIALSGSTGRSTAPHLHFEIRVDGEPVDPLRYVRQP